MVALLPNSILYAAALATSYAPIVSEFNGRKKLRHEDQVSLYNWVHKKAFRKHAAMSADDMVAA